MNAVIDDKHYIIFAPVHFDNLRQLIMNELVELDVEDDKMKEKLGAIMYKFLLSEESFKLTASQCSKVQKELERISLHPETDIKVYNRLFDMLKKLIADVIEMKQTIEFNI